jgi:hypothetical protein
MQFQDAPLAPLGSQKLRSVELLYQIVRLNSPIIQIALAETEVLTCVLNLVQHHPWNNFL